MSKCHSTYVGIENPLHKQFKKLACASKRDLLELATLRYIVAVCQTKGKINSEWIYEIINFPKNDPRNSKDFCPRYYKNSQGRNPSNVLEIGDFINSFWLNLTFSGKQSRCEYSIKIDLKMNPL